MRMSLFTCTASHLNAACGLELRSNLDTRCSLLGHQHTFTYVTLDLIDGSFTVWSIFVALDFDRRGAYRSPVACLVLSRWFSFEAATVAPAYHACFPAGGYRDS